MSNRLNQFLIPIFVALCPFNLPVLALDNSICPIMAKNQTIPEDVIVPFKTKKSFFHSNQKSQTSYLHLSPDGLLNVTSDFRPLVLSDEEINALPIKTRDNIESAKLTALSYESIAEYEAAEKLYQRMLSAVSKPSSDSENVQYDLMVNLSRVKLWEAAGFYEYENEYNHSALTYRQILLTISANQNMELETKLQLVSTIMHRLSKAAYAKNAKRICHQAKQLHDLYTKQLACIQITTDLDSTAWRLEHSGLYDRAEKTYKQSLAFKEKTFGKNNQNTLVARADLARLYANEKRYVEANNIYERTLASYKKIANPGEPYIALLENYGDMLNHINQTAKADEIYNEAKITYSKL
jgi:tetratricopeptide (TPR) repeat protein